MKAAGVEGLSEAQRRADAATYQEVDVPLGAQSRSRHALPLDTQSVSRCPHGCHYCFARRYHTQFELGVGDEFASVILVKTNFADVLTRELDRPGVDAASSSHSAPRPIRINRSKDTTG